MTLAADLEPRLIYITAGSRQEAESIARDLLERQLIACANLFPATLSIYRWEGAIRQEEECIIIAKTILARTEAVISHVKATHSYDTPAILVLPVTDADAAFLSWLAVNTTGA